jgi:hypothetical protein
MFRSPRLRPLFAAAILLCGFALRAQVEPQLATTTDTLDVYKRNAGRSQLVSILDMTTASRAVYEPKAYLTSSSRDYSLSNYAITTPGTISVTAGKDLGFIFVLIKNNGASNNTAKVALLQWPQTNALWPSNSSPLIGEAWNFDANVGGASGSKVTYQATDSATTQQITHVRFTVQGRTIDLPCPSRIFDTPYSATSLETAMSLGIINYQKHALNGTVYDVWADNNPNLADASGTYTAALQGTIPATGSAAGQVPSTVAPNGLLPIGNFFYTFDYFTWIFNSKKVRNPVSVRSQTSYVAAPTTGAYASPSGYAVPATNEMVTVPSVTGTGTGGTTAAVGWYNGLGGMTRYMAQKVASIDVFIAKQSGLNWIYRFLDPFVDNPTSEEGGSATSTFTANPAQTTLWNDASRANYKFLRKLTASDLATNQTAMQVVGPSAWFQVYGKNPTYAAMDMYDSGNRHNLDPRTPQPWAYALANTYYRAGVEQAPTVFDTQTASCPGKVYVMMFPTIGFTDTTAPTATAVAADAAYTYVGYASTGNSGLAKGSFTANFPGLASMTPGSQYFFPGVLSSAAAFGDSTNNSGPWKSAWEISPTNSRGPANPGLQTMVASLGIPGAYKLGAENNGRNPHEGCFRIAQWSNPYRTDMTYGTWRAANGNPDDYSITETDPTTNQPGKVFYFPGSDAATFEADLGIAVSYIVAGSASLSAPATPSTGARVTTQAYFGTFKTATTPIWSGNLYSVGLRTTTDATTGDDTLSFYGANGESTIDIIQVPDPNDPTKTISVSGLNNFDAHHLWSAFDIFGNYLATDYPIGVTPQTAGVAPKDSSGNGLPMAWSDRKVYTLNAAGTSLTRFNTANTSLVNTLTTQLGISTAAANSFINFVLGQHRDTVNHPTLNRIDIMGDIINSSPLAIELGSNNLANLSGISFPSGDNPHVRLVLVGANDGMLHAFAEQAYTDSSGNVKASATEAWAFIPPDMISTMYQIYVNQNSASYAHKYLVDGSPVLFWEDIPPSGSPLGNTRVDSNEDAVVVFGMRKGGRSYYALSVSNIGSGTPGLPTLLWKLNPQDSSSSDLVKHMGASTGTPVFSYVTTDGTLKTKTAVTFIPGGFANAEINRRYRDSGTITAGQGMGRSLLALNPRTGAVIKSWDFSSSTTIGAIPSAVTPLAMLNGFPGIQRVYFADHRGNVMALDNGASGSISSAGYRIDSSIIDNWRSTPRFIYSNSAYQFTSRPAVYALPGGYPVPVAMINNSTTPNFSPYTVMVAIGAGDWNNPTDADESFVSNSVGYTVHPPTSNRMFVFADRQDSSGATLNWDNTGIPDSQIQPIADNTANTTTWATDYTDHRVTFSDPAYFLRSSTGYSYTLLDGTLNAAYNGVTHDKVLVAPLIKDGVIFFSLFDIQGNTGYQCASNSFTRTFRQCDITRPLAIQSQVQQASTVTDINTLNRNTTGCNGLAFYFNSLASEMTDTGTRILQGGAVTASGSSSFSQQTGVNTASVQNSKDTPTGTGFKLRSWRVVH